MLEVRVYDGQDEVQIALSQKIEATKSEIAGLKGLGKIKGPFLQKRLNNLGLEYDKRALELGRKAKYASGSHG